MLSGRMKNILYSFSLKLNEKTEKHIRINNFLCFFF